MIIEQIELFKNGGPVIFCINIQILSSGSAINSSVDTKNQVPFTKSNAYKKAYGIREDSKEREEEKRRRNATPPRRKEEKE